MRASAGCHGVRATRSTAVATMYLNVGPCVGPNAWLVEWRNPTGPLHIRIATPPIAVARATGAHSVTAPGSDGRFSGVFPGVAPGLSRLLSLPSSTHRR